MKTYLSKVLCLLLCLALVFSLVACGSSNTSSFTLDDDDSWDIDDGEDTGELEDGEDIDGEDIGGEDADAGDDTSTESGKKSTKKGGKSGTTTTTTTSTKKRGSKKTAEAIKDADSLSLSQLASKMPSSLRGTTINVASWNPITDVTDADKVIKKFENQTGIKVKWQQIAYEDYDTKLTGLINAKKSPDVIRYISPAPSRMYLCQDMRAATGYDFAGSIWDKRAITSYSYGGKLYGAALKNSFNQQPSVVMYRPSQIKRYKLDDPYKLWKSGKWTYDKFKDICREFKAEVGHAAWMTSRIIDYLWFNDIDLITFNGKEYKNNLSNPKVINGLQEVIKNRDDVCPEAASASERFEDGTYLFETTNIIAARTTDFHYTNLKAKNDLECVPFPVQKGKTYYTNFQEFEAYGIPKGAKNPEAVYYYLRYYLDASNYNEKTFFCSAHTLETYKYLMSQKNYNFNVERQITKAAGNEHGDIDKMIRTGQMTQDQVKTKLDSVTPFFNKAVKQANDTLKKFK